MLFCIKLVCVSFTDSLLANAFLRHKALLINGTRRNSKPLVLALVIVSSLAVSCKIPVFGTRLKFAVSSRLISRFWESILWLL